MSVEDVDACVRDGLGLRWSFMGPFETIEMNAPGGIPDYCARFGKAWAELSWPTAVARAGSVLHLAAAALALGLVAGMYLRGLVLDYRAGWQSTFLEPPRVTSFLSTVLAPAAKVSGVALPDEAGVAALRLGGESVVRGVVQRMRGRVHELVGQRPRQFVQGVQHAGLPRSCCAASSACCSRPGS